LQAPQPVGKDEKHSQNGVLYDREFYCRDFFVATGHTLLLSAAFATCKWLDFPWKAL
jgi:hypothetical protein